MLTIVLHHALWFYIFNIKSIAAFRVSSRAYREKTGKTEDLGIVQSFLRTARRTRRAEDGAPYGGWVRIRRGLVRGRG